MAKILSFRQALKNSENTQRNLLLGNGFSIACEPDIFNYESLYAEASATVRKDMPEVHGLFESLGLKDFEAIILMLKHAHQVLPFYMPKAKTASGKMLKHLNELKQILLTTIADNHPKYPASVSDDKFFSCRKFLAHFIHPDIGGRVYTLNYDLLLYWTLMHDEPGDVEKIELFKNDGFGKDEPDDDYVIWVNETHTRDQRVFYLHGAIHLFDKDAELEKYTWVNQGVPLIEQAREALQDDKFPLFVAEGKSWDKLRKIKYHPYLHHCYKSFLQCCKEGRGANPKSLFIHGHSLADNDSHIIERIGKGSISSLYVSIYGGPDSQENRKIIARTQSLASLRQDRYPLRVSFYDAKSAKVWG